MAHAIPPLSGGSSVGDPPPIDPGVVDPVLVDAAVNTSTAANSSTLFGRGLLYVVVASVQLITGALASPVLAHLLRDPAEFGRLSSAIALHQLLIVVAVIGLDQAVLLKRAEDGHDRNVRALASGAVLVACAATALLWVTARWWAAPFGFEPASPLVTATVLWTVPSAGVAVLLGLLLASDRLRAYSLVSILAAVGGQVLGVALVLTVGDTAPVYAWGLLAADTLAMVVGWCLTRPRWRHALSWPLLKPALLLGLPLMLGSLSSFVLNAGDRIIVQRIAGPAEVGRYQMAYTVGFVAVQLISLTGSAWTPRFAAIADQAVRWQLIGRSRDAIYRLLSPVVLGIILGAPILLRIVAPASFRPETLLVVVYLVLITAYPVTASGATGRMLITARRARPLAVWAGSAAAINIALNLVLVPVAGIAGAAAATVIAYLAQGWGQRISVGRGVSDTDLALGRGSIWPATPPRVLIEALIVAVLAAGSIVLPQTVPWNVARLLVALACLPWAWRQLQRARNDDWAKPSDESDPIRGNRSAPRLGTGRNGDGPGEARVTTQQATRATPPVPSSAADEVPVASLAAGSGLWPARTIRRVLLAGAVLSVLSPALATVGAPVPGRWLLALVFTLCIPGVPVALALRLPNRLVTAALAPAISMAFAVIYGATAVVSGWWHPVAGAWITAGVGLAFSAVAWRRTRPPRRLGPPRWFARLDDGREVPVGGSTLVGRKPAAPRGEAGADVITIADDTRTVSKNHLNLDIGERGMFVVDQGSANGTTVTTVDGILIRCRVGEPVYLHPGSIVSFGRHWFEVVREPGANVETIETSTPPVAAARPGLADAWAWLLGPGRSRSVSLAVIAVAALLWWWQTRHLQLDTSAALGVLPTVGWAYLASLILVAVVICAALLRTRCDPVVLTAAALLVAGIGYATVAVADGQGSVPVGWVHVGFIQYISETGAVPASYDARFSWPGWFAAAAQLVAVAGLADSRTFLLAAPVVYFALALPALLAIGRVITRSWRWAWVGVFIYLVTNWYQQDYFSPQATALVVFLAILATLLWMVDTAQVAPLRGGVIARARRALVRVPGLPTGVSSRTAQWVGLVLVVLIAGLVAGHQLTPVNLVFALLVFTVTGMIRYRLLALVAVLTLVGWFSYGATDYWLGHLNGVIGEVGQVGNALNSSVSERLSGDPTYQSAQFVRIGWSVLLFVSALVGLWFIRRRQQALLLAGLAGAPFGLLLVQSYGGEVIIRCFLYASPILAPLSATAIRSLAHLVGGRLGWASLTGRATPSSRSRRTLTLVIVPVIVVAALVLTFTRGLNVAFERTPPQQAAASQSLYDLAQPGDSVGLPYGVGLSPYLEITDVPVQYLSPKACESGAVADCTGDPLPRFVLITITQERYGELTESRPAGWVWRLGSRLTDSGQYVRIYDSPDAWLLERTGNS